MEAKPKKRIIPTRLRNSTGKFINELIEDKSNHQMNVEVSSFGISNSPLISGISEEVKLSNSPLISELIEEAKLSNSQQNQNIPQEHIIGVNLRFLEDNIHDVEDYAKTFKVQGYMLPKGAMRTMEYLLYLQKNQYCCPKVGTCTYKKALRHITKFQMIKALKERIPNDPVVKTISFQRQPNKLWLEYIFGHKLPNHEIFNPSAQEERTITIPGIERNINTFGKFKPKENGKRRRHGIFARLVKKHNNENPITDRLVNTLEVLTRRQEKFNEDQRMLKEDYAKTINELREIQTKMNTDLSQMRSKNSNLSISDMEYMFNN